MLNKKTLFCSFLTLLVFLSLSFLNVEAKSEEPPLTNEDKKYLYEVLNFTDLEVNTIPFEEAKFLIENQATIVSEFHQFFDMDDVDSNTDKVPSFRISTGDLSFSGKILKLKNTISGYNAFYAYATYDWLKRPFWKLTDKISIGFPTSLGVYMPASGGNITGHHASHWIYNSQTGTTTNYYTTTTVSDADPSGGVASAFNLHNTINTNHRLQGRVSQTFHIKTSLSGKATVKFEYGHKTISGSPTVNLIPSSGLGISPSGNIEVRSYYANLDY